MSIKTTVFGDPHLNSVDDFEVELFESYLKKKSSNEKLDIPDAMILVGDIVDPIPADRSGSSEWKNIEIAEEHVDLGRHLVGSLSELGETYGFSVLSVPGNHDPDIHDSVVEGYENVYNLHNNVFDSEDLGLPKGYSFVGRGAEEFDIGPEIDYLGYDSLENEESFYQNARTDNFSIENADTGGSSGGKEYLDCLVNGVHHVVKGNRSVDELSDDLGITDDEEKRFFREVEKYVEDYAEAENLFKQVDQDRSTVFVNHAAPFNTYIDERYTNEGKVHDGLIVDKNLNLDHEPVLSLNGHHHRGHIEYQEGYSNGTTIVNADKQQIVEIEISENSVAYNPLN